MNERCVDCGAPDAAEFTLAYGADSVILMLCRACLFPAMCTIAATIELFADNPFDKAIARLERKTHNGTANDTDLTDLTRYRRLRDEAKTRHPIEHTMTMRFAYADPPYIGCSGYYDHPNAARWNDPNEHAMLMAELDLDYDGWALSASTPSLAALLPIAPPGVRVAAWVKPFAAYKRNVRVAYTWEPVIWKRTAPRRDGEPVGRDHLSCPITLSKGLVGAKPEAFCNWVLVLLGWMPGDELVDVFPGTGVMGRVVDTPRLML